MANAKFDELNVLKELRAYRDGNYDAVSTEIREILEKLGVKSTVEVENEIYEWFFPMGIPLSDIEKRVNLACRFEDRFIETLIVLYTAHESGADVCYETMEQRFREDYGKAIEDFLSNYNAFSTKDTTDRKFDFAEFVTETTQQNPKEPYSYSEERATTMAKTEAQVMLDGADYKDAIKQGMSRKTWNTIIDGKERPWHHEANGTTIPIDEYFVVDGELMQHPHDPTASARNTVNCRCYCSYE